MNRLMMFLLFAALAVFSELGIAYAFQQEDDVRGAFLTSRPKTSERPASGQTTHAVRRRPRNTSATTTSHNTTTTGPTKTTTNNNKTVVTAKIELGSAKPQPIGMGLTLFMRDANGLSVRVDPSHEFHKNDRVRLLLETNADGYLYVFNTTNDGQPLMIYPDPSLDEAGNYIQAHVPVEVPSSVATEERLRWFRFDADAGTERLYFVFTREPLNGIPLEDELISFCQQNSSNCPMHPAPELWTRIQKELQESPVKSYKAEAFGAAQTASEHTATTRGIGLSQADPEPSLVTITSSSTTGTLVTAVDLIHR